MTSNGLIIFIKNPELGKAKTRIAATVGDKKAMDIYLSLLDITKRVVQDIDANKFLFYSNFVNKQDLWENDLYIKNVQSSGDLGNKMLDAFSKAFTSCNKLLIVGSDCPYVTPEIIQAAFAKLDHVDAVIGPADDGGYYLLGLSSLVPEIFLQMEWSTDQVRSNTESRLAKLGLTFDHLPTLSDIDYWEDWEKYLNTIKK